KREPLPPTPGMTGSEAERAAVADEIVAPNPASLPLPPMARAAEPVPMFNRELSWLEFNQRVLQEAKSPDVPLLERLRFLAITASNLDEFFMVRVGALRDLMTAGIKERSADGLTPKQQLKVVRERSRRLLREMYGTLRDPLVPELKREGIRILRFGGISKRDQASLTEHFEEQIAPILTPLAFDPSHPFPFLSNLNLNLAIVLGSERGEEHVVFIKLPPIIPRFVRVRETTRYVPIELLVAEHAQRFFPGLKMLRAVPFRVIRNADISIREDDVEQDLLQSIEAELRRRERREVVRIEMEGAADDYLMDLLGKAMHVRSEDFFVASGLLRLSDLMQIYHEVKKPALREPPFNPRIQAELATMDDIFSIVRRGDILLHRPYDSFTPVVEFVQAAANDPDVVAIKQSLYRADTASPILEALASAARQGKQVTAVVELQARFDEMRNIAWARRLEEAGVQVVYGLVGLKTHCKICLVVRREEGGLRRYVHLSTGNYNTQTAAGYTDIDMFTVDPVFGEDAAAVLNLLTGFSLASAQEIFEHRVPQLRWKRLVVAPMDFHSWTLRMIDREIANAKSGKPARIRAKMNSLVDPLVIQALYRASGAGVPIELLVRGICCLVPGVAGLSENIRVVSVIDRFLEHSRVFEFANGGKPELWLSSGDWMPRNFFRRVEVSWPVLDEDLKKRLSDEILEIGLKDDVKGWKLLPDGTYRRREGGKVRSQERFIEIARSESFRVGSYEESLKTPGKTRRKAKKGKKKERAPH
ncbi:MAG TPA: polyphosphate kinase 1, partial [Thermoanaerobaculia bacterium]|nr:polyphosphate kinase 1 [Thermoanaerobaculia bacterium]